MRPGLAAERAQQMLAAFLVTGITAAAAHDVSRAWDVWYYHLPFAARLAGVVGAESYGFDAMNQARFAGFPLVTELAQGVLLRLFGRPEAANFVCLASLFGLVLFLYRALEVPLAPALVALLAIPLVQIHATSCYVDLPANAAASAMVLLTLRMYTRSEPAPPREGLWVLGLGAIAANARFQLHPIVLVVTLAALGKVAPPLLGTRDRRALLAMAAFVPLVGASFLKNLALHGNPYYPMELHVGPLVFPGPDSPYSSTPVTLEHAPQAQRFLFSILEIGLPPLGAARRWTIDQWAPNDSPALRMGGFFGAYVVANMVVLAIAAARDRGGRGRRLGIGFALFTGVVANLPQSHELRYYLVWMLTLVSLNLWLWVTAAPLRGLASAPFLAVVLVVTAAGYVYPSGITFADLVREKVDASAIARVDDGARVCVRRPPFTFLYAAPFHGRGRSYFVREAEPDGHCADARPLGAP